MSIVASGSAAIARAAGRASRAMGRGGGTSVPGVVLLRINPRAVDTLAGRLGGGSILVSATNGKTTTTRMLGGALRADGAEVITNAAGANLLSGVAAALVGARPARPDTACGLFECDEAALPAVMARVRPRAIVLMNLFRDQLDRHGELEAIADRWQAMLQTPGPLPRLVLAADDPAIAALGDGCECVWFGLDDPAVAMQALPHAADSTRCRACSAPLTYDHVWFGHLGAWRCPACGRTRPHLDVAVIDAGLRGAKGSDPRIRTPDGEVTLHLTVPGLHNVLNAAAALAGALAMGIRADVAAAAISQVPAAFGRAEHLVVDGTDLVLLLAKNPAGANENVRTLLLDPGEHHLLVALNDRIADGRDVSWIWDVDWEPLLPRVSSVTVTGERAYDLALRFRYAGLDPDHLHVIPDHRAALTSAIATVPPGGCLEVLPTYTAMHDIRADLVARGAAQEFWDEG
ncbi:MAG: MurT ligase domain-containing protein [Miltoncostaeaceae bacterium]